MPRATWPIAATSGLAVVRKSDNASGVAATGLVAAFRVACRAMVAQARSVLVTLGTIG